MASAQMSLSALLASKSVSQVFYSVVYISGEGMFEKRRTVVALPGSGIYLRLSKSIHSTINNAPQAAARLSEKAPPTEKKHYPSI